MNTERKWRLGVVMFVRRNMGNEILVIRKTGRDEWQFPAGGKEGKETVMETARRELSEELHLSIDDAVNVRLSFIVYEYEFPEEWKKRRNCFGQRQFIAIIDLPNQATPVPDQHEIEEARFVRKEQLLETLSHEELRETVKAMMAEGEIALGVERWSS